MDKFQKPHSIEAEQSVIGAMLMDGKRTFMHGSTESSFPRSCRCTRKGKRSIP